MFNNETVVKIAEKQGKTPKQVIIRWLIERSIVISLTSLHKDEMVENIDVFDFALDEEDMAEIIKLDKSKSMFF